MALQPSYDEKKREGGRGKVLGTSLLMSVMSTSRNGSAGFIHLANKHSCGMRDRKATANEL